MSELDLTEQHARERVGFAARVPISISRDDTRDPADHRMLYVLGFGIAGAILTNALVFIYCGRLRVRVRVSVNGAGQDFERVSRESTESLRAHVN